MGIRAALSEFALFFDFRTIEANRGVLVEEFVESAVIGGRRLLRYQNGPGVGKENWCETVSVARLPAD